MTEKKLTPQQRAEKFQEEYAKLCIKWKCQIVSVPVFTTEGRVVAQNNIQVDADRLNDE